MKYLKCDKHRTFAKRNPGITAKRMDIQPKILFVEDEPKLGASVRNELTEQGFSVDLAYDGRTGESMFKSTAYDLVLLDINLPYINGLELCRRFRESNREVPILMLTALGELEDKMDAFSAGADRSRTI